jgi:hypothetical protein
MATTYSHQGLFQEGQDGFALFINNIKYIKRRQQGYNTVNNRLLGNAAQNLPLACNINVVQIVAFPNCNNLRLNELLDFIIQGNSSLK